MGGLLLLHHHQQMFDFVWFWLLKPTVRPIVSLSQCCNPPSAVKRESKSESRDIKKKCSHSSTERANSRRGVGGDE